MEKWTFYAKMQPEVYKKTTCNWWFVNGIAGYNSFRNGGLTNDHRRKTTKTKKIK